MKRILFVDDEAAILDSLKRALRPMREQWDMQFTHSGPEALALLEQQPVDILVSDMRMPGMDGAELLHEVMERYPHTVRFVLSGQSDREMTLRTVMPTHQFLTKPCDITVLKNAIERALALRELLHGSNLQQLVSQTTTLPSMPDLYQKVMHALQSSDASVQEIGQLIEQDMGMSAKVLQLVNSAFFGLPHRVTSPVQAAGLLGLDVLRSLVLMVHVFSQFDRVRVRGFSVEALWSHSFAVASYAQAIARHEHLVEGTISDIYMAGLFHDLGKLILAANYPELYSQVLTCARDQHITHYAAERAVFGATHAEMGAYLLGLWGFGDPIIEASAYHHEPGQHLANGFTAVTAVHVANALVHENQHRQSGAVATVVNDAYLKARRLDDHLSNWREQCQDIGGQLGGER